MPGPEQGTECRQVYEEQQESQTQMGECEKDIDIFIEGDPQRKGHQWQQRQEGNQDSHAGALSVLKSLFPIEILLRGRFGINDGLVEAVFLQILELDRIAYIAVLEESVEELYLKSRDILTAFDCIGLDILELGE